MIFVFFRMLRARVGEYCLTIGIVAVLIAGMSAQSSLSGHSKERIHQFAHQIGSNMLIVSEQTDIGKFFEMRTNLAGMPGDYTEKLFNSPVSTHIGMAQAQLIGESRVNNRELPIIGNQIINKGIKETTIPDAHALIGREAAKQLHVLKGDSIEIAGSNGEKEKFTILNVLDRTDEGLDTGVFIGLGAAQRILGRPDMISSIRISGCWCSLDINELAANVEKNLPGARVLTVQGMIKAQTGMIETVKEYSLLVNLVGGVFIAMIVGLFIYSQTRRQLIDIALFLMVGARPWMIVALFVSSAIMIGFVGGVLGWILGSVLAQKIGMIFIGATPPISGINIGMVVVGAMLISGASALLPALAASRKNPADIFRKGSI